MKKIAVLSGKGGVGKTTISSLMALYLSKTYKVLLLDFDLTGPSISSVFKNKEKIRTNSDNILIPNKVSENLHTLSIGYMIGENDVVIWRSPKRISFLKNFLASSKALNFDYVIVDTPPGISEELTLIHDFKCLVVTSSQNVAVSDASLSLEYCKKYNIEVLGVVENMQSINCNDCKKEVLMFSKGGGKMLSETYNVDYLGFLPLDYDFIINLDTNKFNYEDIENSKIYENLKNIFKKI